MDKTNILYLVVGWLSGILGQIIFWWNSRCHRKNDVEILILSELKDIAFRLSCACHRIQTHFGFENRETLEWLKSKYLKYGGESSRGTIEAIDKLLEYPDEHIRQAAGLMGADEQTGLSIKKISLSLTDSVVTNLSLFDMRFQKRVIDIRYQINVLNQEIENAEYYHRLTFDPSRMKVNAQAIRENIETIYINIPHISRMIIEKIEEILDKK